MMPNGHSYAIWYIFLLTMLTAKKIKYYQQQLLRAQKKGSIYSTMLHWNELQNRKERRTFKRLLKICAQRIVTKYMHDNMKSPGSNPAKSAFLTPSSFDVYFGANTCVTICDGEIIAIRTAYAIGAGTGSIGLDPRHHAIHHIFPELEWLCRLVKEKVEAHYELQRHNTNCDFNQVSVKVYFNNKKTRRHTDIHFRPGHIEPAKSNSQKPNTPVAIAVIGDPKLLKFHQYRLSSDGDSSPTGRTVTFVQGNGSLLVMDPRDEILSATNHYWQHESHLVDGNNDVAISLLFRVVQVEKKVHATTGKFVNPIVGGTGKKERQFDIGWRHIEENRQEHEKKIQEIRKKIVNKLSVYFK